MPTDSKKGREGTGANLYSRTPRSQSLRNAQAGDVWPFRMLTQVFGDPEMAEIWSESATVVGWLAFESALASAQTVAGVIPAAAATAIISACEDPEMIDFDLLYERMRVVGYPILPLIEQLGALGGEEVDRFVHWGATTQDVMDTGLALQAAQSIDRLIHQVELVGDSLAALIEREKATPMVARTHAQHAVPTTFGAKFAVLLAEFTRHYHRLISERAAVAQVSFFGAGGTSDAYGPSAGAVRKAIATELGLGAPTVPWHTARDALASTIWLCVALTATCAKIGTEVIELSRPEIAELSEGGGRLRGASSTMPQKVNPIASEVLVGIAGSSIGYSSSAALAMRAGHERSTGEWQVEWNLVPSAFVAASSSLMVARDVIERLELNRDRMRLNLDGGNGLIMAEAAMMQLARTIGRHRAHEIVYDSCADARRDNIPLSLTLAARLAAIDCDVGDIDLEPRNHLGEAMAVVDCSRAEWAARNDAR